MPTIRMLETRLGSPDGHNVYTYLEGETYSADTTPALDDDLASVFLREGWAIDPDAPAKPSNRSKKIVAPDETKDDEAPAGSEPEQAEDEASPDAEQAPAENA